LCSILFRPLSGLFGIYLYCLPGVLYAARLFPFGPSGLVIIEEETPERVGGLTGVFFWGGIEETPEQDSGASVPS